VFFSFIFALYHVMVFLLIVSYIAIVAMSMICFSLVICYISVTWL